MFAFTKRSCSRNHRSARCIPILERIGEQSYELPQSDPFHVGPGFWTIVPADSAPDLLRHHTGQPLEVITDYQLPISSSQNRLELVVMLAVEAELIIFNAATLEPCQENHNILFADSLGGSLQPVPYYIQ